MAGSGSGSREHSGDVAGLIRRIAVDPGRHIPMSAMLNFRDVGGYPVAGGGAIAWRTLLRSDAPGRIDDAALELLVGLNLRTVVDLRTSAETQIVPSPLDGLADRGTMTAHISLIGEDTTVLPGELAAIYQFIVDRQGAAIGAAIRFLARPGALPGLVHCTAGKDRTGIVVALVLACVGVPDDVIAADYALTSLYLDLWRTPAIGRVRGNIGMDDRLTMALMVCPPELILGVLDRARQRGGTIEGYLAACGVTPTNIGLLREALVTASTAGPGPGPGPGVGTGLGVGTWPGTEAG